jgi:hypothetical protein
MASPNNHGITEEEMEIGRRASRPECWGRTELPIEVIKRPYPTAPTPPNMLPKPEDDIYIVALKAAAMQARRVAYMTDTGFVTSRNGKMAIAQVLEDLTLKFPEDAGE